MTPLSAFEVIEFEQVLGVALPASYRHLLEHIGTGAGPYYGLLHWQAVVDMLAVDRRDLQQERGIDVHPALPFPFSRSDAEVIAENWRRNRPPYWLHRAWPCDGYIPIAHHGCAYWSALVTSGELSGTVWDFDTSEGLEDAKWNPAPRPIGIIRRDRLAVPLRPLPVPPPFEEWYQGWLDQSLADLTI